MVDMLKYLPDMKVKQITNFSYVGDTCSRKLVAYMLSCANVFLVQVSCTKQNAALFRASLYKNLYELESNSDFVRETYTSFLHKFLVQIS